MQSTFTGNVHGRTIELERDTSFPDGAKVHISLESADRSSHGDLARAAVLDSAGGWTDAADPEFGRWLESTRQMRCGEFIGDGSSAKSGDTSRGGK